MLSALVLRPRFLGEPLASTLDLAARLRGVFFGVVSGSLSLDSDCDSDFTGLVVGAAAAAVAAVALRDEPGAFLGVFGWSDAGKVAPSASFFLMTAQALDAERGLFIPASCAILSYSI